MSPSFLNRRRASAARFALVSCAAAITSCAVLTVDVDVYKGVLSHHEDVQLQEMITLTSAAKPLLTELRDKLEWRGKMEKRRERAILDLWYSPDFVPDERMSPGYRNKWRGNESRSRQRKDPRDFGFKTANARRVNAVLSLYEDLSPHLDTILIEDLRDAYGSFMLARQRFNDASNWDSGLIHAAREVDIEGAEGISRKEVVRQFLRPDGDDFRNFRLLMFAAKGGLECQVPEELRAAIGALEYVVDGSSNQPKRINDGPTKLSSNAGYALLARKDVADTIADCLFPDSRTATYPQLSSPARKLSTRIRTLGSAFVRARESSSTLIDTALLLLIDIEGESGLVGQRRALAELLSELIDPSYLLAFLSAPDSADDLTKQQLLGQFEDIWDKAVPQFSKTDVAYLKQSSRERLQRGIESLLVKDDSEFAELLLRIHRRIPVQGEGLTAASTPPKMAASLEQLKYFKAHQRRAYGLALGTALHPESSGHSALESLRIAWSSLFSGSDLGLGEARLEAGVNSAVRSYLNAHDDLARAPSNAHLRARLDVETVRTREVLIRFASKLLLLSNHEQLINPTKPRGIVPLLVASAYQQAVGGSRAEDWLSSKHEIFEGRQSVNSVNASYARILQATGNSILTLADAQLLDEADRNRDKTQAAVERTAIKGLAASNALEVLGEVSMQLSAESGPHTKKAEALTAAKKVKEAELQKLVGEDGTVDDLKAGSLKVLSDKIEGLKAINVALTAATEEGKGWVATTLVANTNLKPVDEALKNYLEALAEVHKALPAKPKSPAPAASGMQLPTPSVKVPGDSKLVALIDEAVAAGRLVEAALDKGRKSLPTSTAIKVGEEAIAGLDPTKLKDDDGKKLVEIRKSIAKAELSKRDLKQTDAAWSARKKDLIADLKKLREQACSGDLPADTLNSSCKRIDEVQTAIASYLGDLKKWRTAAEPSIAASDTLKTIAAAAKTQLAPVVAELEEGKKAAKSLSAKIAKEEKEAKAQEDAAKELTTAVSAIAAYIKAHSGAVRQDNGAGNSTPAKPNGTDKKKEKDKGPALIPIVRATGSMDVADSNTEEEPARPAAPTAAQSTSRNLIEEGPSDAIINLIAWLGEQGNADHKAAAPVISARRFSIPSIDMEALAKAEDPRLVLDYLLGSLQHAYIDAVRKGGADSDSAKRLNAAYDAAVARRASMVRVIPASSYLSSSFPATTLQSNPTLGGTNELRSDGIENIPIIADIRNALFPAERDAERIQSEIDKQNWQNINRVRVSGTGKTNYAIAKDDLGNWYVKAYSADPNKILGAARNLALGSLGNEIGADVLSRAQRLDAAAKGQPEPDLAIERTALGRLQTRYREDYEKALTSQQDRLADDLKAKVYEGALNASWAALEAPEELKNWEEDLKSAVTTHLDPTAKLAGKKVDLTNDSTADDNHLDLVTDSLNGVLTFFRTLDGQLMTRVATAKSDLESSSATVKKETEALAELTKKAKTAEDSLAAANKALTDLAKDAKDDVVTKAKELVKSAEADAKTANEAKTAGEKTLADAKTKEAAHKTALAKNQAARERARDVGRTTLGRFTGAIETALADYASGVKFLSSAVEEEAEPATAALP